jgi:hypothetical protein
MSDLTVMNKLILICSMLVASTTWGAENNCTPIFINYSLDETIIEESSVQEVRESYLINQSGLLQYSKSSVTTGSRKTLAVDTYENYNIFHNEKNSFPDIELEKLAKYLKKNKILEIESDNPANRNAGHSNYSVTINYRAFCEERTVEFRNKEASEARAIIIYSIKSFFEKIASASSVEKEAITSQGDQVVPIEVDINELLKSPEKYNGQRVRTSGRYDLKFEYSGLSSGSGKLWLDGPAFFSRNNIDMEKFKQKEISVEGVFFSGASGHLGGWPGKISRVTNIVER